MKENYIFSIFLDKDLYFDKNIKIDSKTINNLADIISFYLENNSKITHILIAGGCYGRNEEDVEKLCRGCFSTVKKETIFKLIRKYRFFDYEPTNKVLKKKWTCSYPSNEKEKSDHRKMMFFLSYNKEKKNLKEYNKKDLSQYLVEGILMGSSNFSPNTYLTENSSEADILLLRYDKSSNDEFIKIIKEEIERGENKKFVDNFIVSKSLNSNKFLQEIFESLNLQDIEFFENI